MTEFYYGLELHQLYRAMAWLEPTTVIEYHSDDHLPQFGTMVRRLPMLAEALAAGAVEHQRGGIEQHHGEIAE